MSTKYSDPEQPTPQAVVDAQDRIVKGLMQAAQNLEMQRRKKRVSRDPLTVFVYHDREQRHRVQHHTALHFRDAAHRARFERGEIDLVRATRAVPVYRGFDVRAARAMSNDYKQRKEIERGDARS